MGKKKRKIDWLNHFLEFIVVIIGILIAFELNQKSEQSDQSKTVDIHFEQIREEALFNKYSFERSIRFAESNLNKLDTIMQLIRNKKEYDKVNKLSIELLNLGGVYIRKNAYRSLIESGDIRFIDKFSQKQEIINLYEYFTWVESYNDISMSLYSSDYYPYLRDNFDLVNLTIQPNTVYESLKFNNILGSYYRTSANRLKKYKEGLEEIEKYLSNTK